MDGLPKAGWIVKDLALRAASKRSAGLGGARNVAIAGAAFRDHEKVLTIDLCRDGLRAIRRLCPPDFF